MIDLKLLEMFVVVAEEKSFSRAALRLSISQPPLSKAIKKLEHQLKVQLFNRTTRKVSLTPEGVTLLQQAVTLKNSVNKSLQSIHDIFSPLDKTIRVGGTTLSYLEIIPPLIRQTQRMDSEVDLQTVELSNSVIIDQLLCGELDIGFVLLPFRHPDLAIYHLTNYTMKLAVAKDFMLPETQPINLAYFKNENFIVHNRFINPGMYDEVLYCCKQAHFEPKLKELDQQGSCMAQVSINAGVHFVVFESALDHVQYVDVFPNPELKVGVAYRPNNTKEKLKPILDIINRSNKFI